MSQKLNEFKGKFDACAHRVTFWYRDFQAELTDELLETLKGDAEERARELIAKDCVSGELNCLYVDDSDNSEEIRGWWSIDND